MRSFRIGRASILLAAAALALAVGSPTASALPTQPRLTTGGALHMLVSSAELTAVVNPEGFATSCYFQYGTTSAYGAQTVPVDVGSGSFRVKVGQSVAGLQQGNVYHYRAVAVYGGGRLVYGRDRSFLLKTATPKIELARVPQVVVGTPFMVTGTLTGTGNANKTVTLQATSFPYLEAFATIGLPAVTNASGRFAFRVANLKRSTEFRVLTVEPSPAYSPVLKVGAAPRVTFRARSSGVGLVRLYGTVSPAAVGARVLIQVEKSVRPGPSSSEETSRRFVTQFATVVKRATRTTSRFSTIVRLRHGGRYRAYVKLRPGPLVSGPSIQTLVLHASKAKR